MQKLSYIFLICIALFSCQQENSTIYPISEYASSWVPEDQDSVLFLAEVLASDTAGFADTNYLQYSFYGNKYSGGNPNLETITQSAINLSGTLQVNYFLQSGVPYSIAGAPAKDDVLTLTHLGAQSRIHITNTQVYGDFYLIDSLFIADQTFTSVLTDSTGYYFTQTDGIVLFDNGSRRFYKAN